MSDYIKTPIGRIPLPSETFEHDLTVCDRYQNFSAELLRLSLAGIGAVGFMVTSIFLSKDLIFDKSEAKHPIYQKLAESNGFKLLIIYSLISLGTAALAALIHRFVSSDSMAYTLSYLRLRIKAGDTKFSKDQILAKSSERKIICRGGGFILYWSMRSTLETHAKLIVEEKIKERKTSEKTVQLTIDNQQKSKKSKLPENKTQLKSENAATPSVENADAAIAEEYKTPEYYYILAMNEKSVRDYQLVMASWVLFLSGLFLMAGAGLLIAAIGYIIF